MSKRDAVDLLRGVVKGVSKKSDLYEAIRLGADALERELGAEEEECECEACKIHYPEEN